ncbi:MAG: imidazoleglycerol-phosphate dehydratase HisB [Oscillospiraceae bacterium]|jgi:imidazoleglycerol-phosphate dehydratase|nr:imidazoleglycerol-phosphate dehydratase HisB [Oscillospiraceae bacterium]
MRKAEVRRVTRETRIELSLSLDGSGQTRITTGVGFFDHMLDALCRFGMLDLDARCDGDLNVDAHHTVEDVGLCLGQAIGEALGEKRGVRRAAHAFIPMDEALAFAAVDLSGRPFLQWDWGGGGPDAPPPDINVGAMPARLFEEFFRAVCQKAGLTCHIRVTGRNAHHMLEAVCKAFGRSLDDAKRVDERQADIIPSTKGVL